MSEDGIEKRMQQIREIASKYAKASADRQHIDEFKKSKLAILMKQAMKEGHESAAAQEREARAHPEYLALLDGLKEATEQAETLRWELKIVEMKFEAWRTVSANHRAERSKYGA